MKRKQKKTIPLFLLYLAFAGTYLSAAPNLDDILFKARSKLGSPYMSGRTGPNSFDCSGFIYYLLSDAVPGIPRRSGDMGRFGQPVSRTSLLPGDIVLYATTGVKSRISHVALYLGNNSIIHAISDGPNRGVTITSMDARYWRTRYHSARRVLPSPAYSGGSGDSGETAPKPVSGIAYAKGTYRGDVKYSEPHGTGVFYFNNGDIYEGDFRKGLFHGSGVYTWKDGTVLRTTFSNGSPAKAPPDGKRLYMDVEDSPWETWDGDITGDYEEWKTREEADFEAFKAREPGN